MTQRSEKESFFRFYELTKSKVARAHGLANEPGETEKRAICQLIVELLDPLRKLFGEPIYVSSGYRSVELNKLVGGVRNSQHMKGEAADLYTGNTKRLLRVLLESKLLFDQAIYYRQKDFLHVSYTSNRVNRKQVLYR